MKKSTLLLGIYLLALLQACGQESKHVKIANHSTLTEEKVNQSSKNKIINRDGITIVSRISPPTGFQRTESIDNSFADYLRLLPLKPYNSEVRLFDGRTKSNDNIYEAVVDLAIGTKDLHQCADAVMRLRAEYLWNQKRYDKIHFNFTNGFRVDYSEWMKGKRIIVKGNSTFWSKASNPSNTYSDFWGYLETIFTYAGTLSLSKELKPVTFNDLQIGDIFIKGGTPGHAIIVVDLATDIKTNKKIFLLAQSYMPAQEIQILKNPNDETISPWYSTDFEHELITPEWSFTKFDLKRFEE